MSKIRKNKLAIFLFMFPATVLFIVIIIAPIGMSGYYSLLDWDGMTKGTFVGLQNYKELFSSNSIGFLLALKNAFLLAILSTAAALPISLMLALVLAKGIRGERFFVSALFVPTLISSVVIGQLWSKIYNPEYGILNTVLRNLGLEELCRTWLGDPDTALISVFVVMLWQYMGYHMLLLYAGIKTIPPELREAATIDGASEWQVSRYISIPMVKSVIQMCVIFAVVGAFKAFDLIYVLTNGGPAHASEVPSTLMINMIFGRNRYGLGSSIAVIIIFSCFFFAILIKKLFKDKEEGEKQ